MQFLDPQALLWSHRKGWAQSSPPMVEEFDGSYWARHQENIAILRRCGAEAFQASLEMMQPESPFCDRLANVQTVISRELAGVDVYWDGLVEDVPTSKDPDGLWYRKLRHNSSRSCWGTLRVYSFPFTAIFRYDDCDDLVVMSAAPLVNRVRRFPKHGVDQLEDFVRINTDPRVIEVRDMRTKMRAMDEQVVTAHVKHGSRNEVRGTFHLRQTWEKGETWRNPFTSEIMSLSPGFEWAITTVPHQKRDGIRCVALVCGEPELQVHPDNFARRDPAEAAAAAAKGGGGKKKGRTMADEDEDDDLDNAPRALAKLALGVQSETFSGDDEALEELIAWPGNVDPELLEYVRKLSHTYRAVTADAFEWKRHTLSYDFHMRVYRNHNLTREQLTDFLRQHEGDGSVLTKDLVHGTAKRTYSHLLMDLFHRLAFFDGSLRAVCWYMFWHGVALNNRARNYDLMKRPVQKKLDPSEPGAPVTRVLPRADCEALLAKLGVYGSPTDAITDTLLDNLYEKMAEVETLTLKHFSKKWQRNVDDAKRVIGRTEEQQSFAEKREAAAAAEEALNRAAELERITRGEEESRFCSQAGGCALM